MQKKIFILVIAIVMVISLAFYYLYIFQKARFNEGSVIDSVPLNTPVLIRINNGSQLLNSLNTNPMWAALSSIPQLGKAKKVFSWADSTSKRYPEPFSILLGREWYIAFYKIGNNEVAPVYLSKIGNKAEADQFSRLAKMLNEQTGFQIFNRKFQGTSLYETINPKNGQMILAWAMKKGLLMIGPKSQLIEDLIKGSDNEEKGPEFEMIVKTLGQQCDLNLLINHEYAGSVFSPLLGGGMQQAALSLEKLASWTGLDVSLRTDRVTLSGFSAVSAGKPYLANQWLKQSPAQNTLDQALPQSTAWFMSYSIADPGNYFASFQEFLLARGQNLQRENQLKKMANLTATQTEEVFTSLFDQDMAMAMVPVSQGNTGWGRIWIVKVKSGRAALEQFAQWQANYLNSMNLPATDWQYEFTIDNTQRQTVYRNPFPTLPSALFGDRFDSLKVNYFTSFDNYLFFADSKETMASLLQSNILGETLKGNTDFNKFQASLTSASNVNFYVNTNTSLPLADQFFNKALAESLFRNDQAWKFRMFEWQAISTQPMMYNSASLIFNEEQKSKPQTVWRSHLETQSDFKPQFMKNHDDPLNREIMVQDRSFNLYLMNHVGRVLWKIRLDSKIMGEIHQIDFFKNGKLQYLFNTENRLYLIDRNGNNVGNYPLILRDKASNGVSVFDYDNNLNYRFFLACADKKVYAYEPSGRLVEGWEIFQTDHPVRQSIEYFRSEGKDYIVVTDEMKDYILNRKGEIRVPTETIFPHSANNPVFFEDYTPSSKPRIIGTDHTGKIHYTYLDGQTAETAIKTFPPNHFFAMNNLDSDENLEYVFAYSDTLEIYDHDLKPILQKKIGCPISHAPNFYLFSNDVRKISVVCQSSSQIFLFDPSGQLHNGFPLVGSSPFSIGFFTGASSNFNLLVGGPDGYIYNYYVE